VTVYLVGAGPGDPGLLTLRGAELLSRADVVVYDRLVDPTLLLLAPPGATFVDVGKVPGAGRTPEGAARQGHINRLLVEHGRDRDTVVRLKGGDPYVFGRGGEEAEALDEAGLDWEVVPGVTSAFAVPAVAGVPVTHRGLSTSATVVTGHVGDPTAAGAVDWESLGRAGGTLVVLMGMATRAEIARRLLDSGRPASTPVAVVEWGTTPRQRAIRTTLADLHAVELGSPAVMVIGAVAELDLGGPAKGSAGRLPLLGTTVVVTRPRQGRPLPGGRRRRDAADLGVASGDTAGALRQSEPDRLADALRDAGARVLPVASIAIVDPDDEGAALFEAAANIGRYRWVVFTSQHAVERFFARLTDVRSLADIRVAAVGAATAAALTSHRVPADLVPPRPSAEGLVEVFPDAAANAGRDSASAERVLFPCAAQARPTLPKGLRARGWVVDEVPAYRTLPAAAPPDALLPVIAAASAVTFSSPSAVDAYLSMRTANGEALPVPATVVCIGAVTADAARAAGLDVGVEVPVGHPEAVVAALAERVAARGGRADARADARRGDPPDAPPASSLRP